MAVDLEDRGGSSLRETRISMNDCFRSRRSKERCGPPLARSSVSSVLRARATAPATVEAEMFWRWPSMTTQYDLRTARPSGPRSRS